MITRGWIAPDGTEHQISAGDSFFKGFIQCLELIEEKNPAKYYEILNQIDTVLFKTDKLVDYAVKELGFMMVGEYDLKVVACTEDNYESEFLKPYKDADYTIHAYLK